MHADKAFARAMSPVLDANGCVTGWTLNVVRVIPTPAVVHDEPDETDTRNIIVVDASDKKYVKGKKGVSKWA